MITVKGLSGLIMISNVPQIDGQCEVSWTVINPEKGNGSYL